MPRLTGSHAHVELTVLLNCKLERPKFSLDLVMHTFRVKLDTCPNCQDVEGMVTDLKAIGCREGLALSHFFLLGKQVFARSLVGV